MLGVKLITPNGSEQVLEARTVQLGLKENAQTSNERCVYIQTEDSVVTVDCGSVYVMNRYGKTIAHYNFESSTPAGFGYPSV